MDDTVKQLKEELCQKGWSYAHNDDDMSLTFTRGESRIIGHQEYVEYKVEDLSTWSEAASRMWTMQERLDFLVENIRTFAERDDRRFLYTIGKGDVQMPTWMVEIQSRPVQYAIISEELIVFTDLKVPILADPVEELELCQEQLRTARDDIAKLIQAAIRLEICVRAYESECMCRLSESRCVSCLRAQETLAELQSGEVSVEGDVK